MRESKLMILLGGSNKAVAPCSCGNHVHQSLGCLHCLNDFFDEMDSKKKKKLLKNVPDEAEEW